MLNELLVPPINDLDYESYQIGNSILKYSSNGTLPEGVKIAVIGVPEGRKSGGNSNTSDAAQSIRKELYELSMSPTLKGKLIDMGDLRIGNDYSDSEAALKLILKELRSKGLVCVVMGGSVALTFPMYASLEGLDPNIDISYISHELPFLDGEILSRICEHRPNYLFNINALGYQNHYIPSYSSDTIKKLGFEQLRLGELKNNLAEAEPLIRNSHLVSIDIGVVKQSDAPANFYNNPNGLEGDKACQLCYYAGVSDLNQLIGIFELNPEFDHRDQSSKLVSQMIWYYLDGYSNRVNDHPLKHQDFLRYRCNLDNKNPDIIFHKSKRTSRWWMEIPNPRSLNNKEMNVFVPCSYTDYQSAAHGELPDRYLRTIQKMH